ncbi:MAG: hypothetical protein VYD75_09925 [Pseudomonadota bacterium]|nr:hypothetical protein [Pseudomonadota bacterium]
MTRILPLGEKAALAAGSGNATTVGNATVVRVLSNGGAALVFRTDSDDNVIGSFTTVNGTADLVEKNASDKIYVTGNAVEVSKVGFTN